VSLTFPNNYDGYILQILKMNDGMDRVKSEHDRMDNMIDYIKNYQKDFETLLETVEANCLEPTTTTPERAELYVKPKLFSLANAFVSRSFL